MTPWRGGAGGGGSHGGAAAVTTQSFASVLMEVASSIKDGDGAVGGR
jgi:hypothetical protein